MRGKGMEQRSRRREGDRRVLAGHRPEDPGPRRCALLAVGLLTVLLAGVPAVPASAHDGLLTSDPADGVVLTAEPSQVILTFSGDQLAVGAVVVVTSQDGAAWSDGDAVVEGAEVTQALASGLPGGAYTVRWRSVAGDGHPVEGAFGFTLDLASEPSASEPSAPGPTDSSPTAASDATPSPETPETTSGAAELTTPAPGSGTVEPGGPGGWLVAGLVVTAVGAAGVVAAVRRNGPRG